MRALTDRRTGTRVFTVLRRSTGWLPVVSPVNPGAGDCCHRPRSQSGRRDRPWVDEHKITPTSEIWYRRASWIVTSRVSMEFPRRRSSDGEPRKTSPLAGTFESRTMAPQRVTRGGAGVVIVEKPTQLAMRWRCRRCEHAVCQRGTVATELLRHTPSGDAVAFHARVRGRRAIERATSRSSANRTRSSFGGPRRTRFLPRCAPRRRLLRWIAPCRRSTNVVTDWGLRHSEI